MSNVSLYMVLLGGKHEKANIEVHDIIPVAASKLEESYEYLKQAWFGQTKGLHLDGWMQINGVTYHEQAYKVEIKDYPQTDLDLQLYLINLGAYIPTEFGEIHKYVVVAGSNVSDAKAQGKLAIEKSWFKPHTDAIIDVDDCLALSQIQQKYVHLIQSDFVENTFTNDYIVIG